MTKVKPTNFFKKAETVRMGLRSIKQRSAKSALLELTKKPEIPAFITPKGRRTASLGHRGHNWHPAQAERQPWGHEGRALRPSRDAF